MSRHVVVVGAGIGGLVCARRILKAGHQVTVLEKDDRIGGRMKTDIVDGFRIDRGFQVAFTAYPYLKREVDYKALDLRKFDAGCKVVWKKRLREVSRDKVMKMVFSTFLEFTYKYRMKGYSSMMSGLSPQQVWQTDETTVAEELRINGLDGSFIDRFARPFFGGVFLDRSLDLSQRPFRYVWKMLADGETVIPALGIEEIPKQVASDLPPECIRCNTEVESLIIEGGRLRGVVLKAGENIEADAVVIATDARSTHGLTTERAPIDYVSCVALSFASNTAPFKNPTLVVNGNSDGPVSHMAVVSNIAPETAPTGQHLISLTVLGSPTQSDEQITKEAIDQVTKWFPFHSVQSWRLLRLDRIPIAQYAQKVGFDETLATPRGTTPGLYFAGEQTTYSSIDGACLSGAQTASAVIEDLGAE